MGIIVFLLGLFIMSTGYAAESGLNKISSTVVPDTRFYSVLPVDLDGDGTEEIIAAGETVRDSVQSGYVVVWEKTANGIRKRCEDIFSLDQEGSGKPVRVRTIAVIPGREDLSWPVIATGKAGGDEDGIGFIHLSMYRNKAFTMTQSLIISVPNRAYSHGYGLDIADINSDGKEDIIYGGFNGDGQTDYHDIRQFYLDQDRVLREATQKPFARLEIPMRVNGLISEDLDGDGEAEVVIAGRTQTGEMEKAAVAIWSKNALTYYTLD
jgi:hypothetical protein